VSRSPRRATGRGTPAKRAGLTNAELLRKLRVLQQQVDVGGLHDLHAHHEELRTQNEQLIEAHQALEQGRDRYLELFDLAPVGYATLSSVGMIEEANLTLARLLGLERPALVRRSFRIFVDPPDRRAFLDHLAACSGGGAMRSVELHLRTAAAVRVPVRLTTRSIASSSIWTVVSDLTEQASMELERREVDLRELAARTASEAKDRFLAILNHELRTPLTPILAAVSSFAEIADTPPALRPLLEIVRRNVVAETRLIDDLLDVTRIEHGKLGLELAPIDLHEVVRDAAREQGEERTGRSHEVALDLAAAAHHVNADRMRLRQVFANLLGNARRCSPDGGRITLRTLDDGPGWVRCSVADQGIGIEPELVPQLFVAFKQADRPMAGARGLGLGLAICKGIVVAHGGEIAVESRGLGRGTTVTLRFPTSTAVANAPPPAPHPPAPSRSLRILLVEDDPDSAAALSMLLELHRHEVVVAATCHDALERIEPPPDLLISDLDLPDGSGLELVREIRRTRSIPALALSGHGSIDDVRRSREAGFQEHVVKPVEWPKLAAAIVRATAAANRPR